MTPQTKQSILVLGGAGYIGSHMVLCLRAAGYEPIVLDNLSTGHREAVLNEKLIVGNYADADLLQDLFSHYHFEAVMHFAGCIEVGESVSHPLKYYQNNLAASITLLEMMQKHQINKLIFSSTAAVYGAPLSSLITESHSLSPLNPYGQSKLMVERIIQDAAKAHGLTYVILRYFNAAGAHSEAPLRENHRPETHLIPLLLQVASGQRENITVFGTQYPTPDGTCIRDYIHVTDLCEAHLCALEFLLNEKKNIICNLGTGQGSSVLEVIEAVRRITHHLIPVVQGEARSGDPARLVADVNLAHQTLGWKAKSNLDQMIADAWRKITIEDCFVA